MMYDYNDIYYPDYLMHYGVKGMKWGVRRRSQAVVDAHAAYKSAKKDYNKAYNKAHNYSARHPISQWTGGKKQAEADRRWDDAINKAGKLNKAKSDYKTAKKVEKAAAKAERNTPEAKAARRKEAVKIGAAVAGTALASYGVYKVSQTIKDKNFKHHMDQGMKSLDKLAARGRFDDGMEGLKDVMSTQYNAKVSDIVKQTISNNSVNGKVDWKSIRDMYK